ncbi:LM6179_1298 family efflux MFS transporter [Listeria monocytogenes]|uniref:MFS transporter n=1 Tax=Listeria monocytogenes TaxID=1639 RepID=A0A6X4PQE7_LISMN|nr:LM6179_1298 family efflux MFS transporter [Listeria monocytogenes]EAC4041097.1 DHA2 family efflux MFS transporter permease subunit [Listeria monocytogenes]EAC4314362.1 DHA2 family efflux MFS transporter permease subunit [Listeria monocytogenes]EAC6739995.1 DHA2 family efflux MFS transporter permease subunit [Listeria monocytogenes]EAC7896476.1 DHA2 family efflux MFS transporter permease subunit [Listeria monocytogenes]EAC7953968.1 DHA2 family efflux MFS transporter permease subunit [Listeri
MEQTKVKAVTIAVFVATFMAAIEGTIVSTAMPTIVSQLDGIELMNWIFSVYLLTSAVTVPIYGKLSDLYGRKNIFVIATIIFIIGSSLCGFAQNMEQLIIFRAIQGIGAGGILPSTMTIIADVYPFEKRAKVLGFMGSAWGIAGVFGPLVGGFLVDQLSWHWIFFINVPIGILTILLILLYLREKVEHVKLPIDYLGASLFTVALLGLLFALQRAGESLNWTEPLVVILFAVSIVLFIAFYFVEKRAKDPIMPFVLFKNPVVLIGNLIGFLISAFLIGINVYIPMWAQGMLGHGATIAGFMLAPLSVTWIVGSFIGGKLLMTLGNRHTVGIGVLITSASGLILALFPASTNDIFFYLNSAFMGFGFGIIFTTTTVTVQDAVPRFQTGIATASNTLFRTVGQTIGVAVFGTIFNSVLTSEFRAAAGSEVNRSNLNQLISPQTSGNVSADLVDPLRDILYSGLHMVFWVMFACCIVSYFIHFILPKKHISGEK